MKLQRDIFRLAAYDRWLLFTGDCEDSFTVQSSMPAKHNKMLIHNYLSLIIWLDNSFICFKCWFMDPALPAEQVCEPLKYKWKSIHHTHSGILKSKFAYLTFFHKAAKDVNVYRSASFINFDSKINDLVHFQTDKDFAVFSLNFAM